MRPTHLQTAAIQTKTPKQQKKPKENNNNKANLGPLKAHFLVKAGNGRFGCYILNLHVSHVIYTLDSFYVTLLYMKNKAHVGPWSSGQYI